MTDDNHRSPVLTLRVIYEDLPDLIEVEAQIVAGCWSGVAGAYTGPCLLSEKARGLLTWAERPCGEYVLEAGADTGIGWICLRWYVIDRAGHLACHTRIATRALSGWSEEGWRISLEFLTEPALVGRFARQLASLAQSLTGEATLAGI